MPFIPRNGGGRLLYSNKPPPLRGLSTVIYPRIGIEGPVLFDADAGETTLDEDAMTVSHRGKAYKVFDRLTVQVEVEQLPAHRSRLLITVVPDDTPLGEVKFSGESRKLKL